MQGSLPFGINCCINTTLLPNGIITLYRTKFTGLSC